MSAQRVNSRLPGREVRLRGLGNRAMTPSDDLVRVATRLGSRDARVRHEAEETLRAQGEAGMEALLAVWARQQTQVERRGGAAAGAFLLFLGVGGVFVWQHWAALTDAEALACLLVFTCAFVGAILYTQPPGATRLRKHVALALTHFDDPRVLLPLAQSLCLITRDDAQNRAVVLNALREQLKRVPDHQVLLPGTGCVLRWAPERTRRTVRWFWLWLEMAVFIWPLVALVLIFFRLPHEQGTVLGLGLLWPAMFTVFAVIGNTFREDVVYERLPARRPWRALAWVGATVLTIGLTDHLVTGRPSWLALVLTTLAVPSCFALIPIIDRMVFAEAPLSPRHSDGTGR